MQFQKGQSGNPAGRRPGSFGPASILAAALREGEAEMIARTTIEKAIAGDNGALRICWQRLDPLPRHDRVVCDIPRLEKNTDCRRVVAGIVAAVAGGQLSTREGAELAKVLDPFVRSLNLASAPDEPAPSLDSASQPQDAGRPAETVESQPCYSPATSISG